MGLYTRNGRPLQQVGSMIYSASGALVGKRDGEFVFGQKGEYVGTIQGDRLVYFAAQSSVVGGAFTGSNIAGSAAGAIAGSGISGDEPNIPD
jgi:hypothetical protein